VSSATPDPEIQPKPANGIFVTAISDLHGHLPTISKTDLLLISGDLCPIDNHAIGYQRKWLLNEFSAWARALPTEQIMVIAGNHDFVFEQVDLRDELAAAGVTYLEDSSADFHGWKVWGSPWVPNLQSWAFYSSDDDLAKRYSEIPDSVDILLSHGPPLNWLDSISQPGGALKYVGAPGLEATIERISPALVVCGHIHENYGARRLNSRETLLLNASQLDDAYQPAYVPIQLWLERNKAGDQSRIVSPSFVQAQAEL